MDLKNNYLLLIQCCVVLLHTLSQCSATNVPVKKFITFGQPQTSWVNMDTMTKYWYKMWKFKFFQASGNSSLIFIPYWWWWFIFNSKYIFSFTTLSTDMMKFQWKPALREAPHSPLHSQQFSLQRDPCHPCPQTGRLTRSSSKFTWPFPAVRRSSWSQMSSSSGNITSTPSPRRTCQRVRPPPPPPPAGWEGEERRERARPGVSRPPVSPSLRSPPSLSVSRPVRLPASLGGF